VGGETAALWLRGLFDQDYGGLLGAIYSRRGIESDHADRMTVRLAAAEIEPIEEDKTLNGALQAPTPG
jgi:hypothetical protein